MNLRKTQWFNQFLCRLFQERALLKVEHKDGSIEWDSLKPYGGPTLAFWRETGLDFRFFPTTWEGRTGFYYLKEMPYDIQLVATKTEVKE